MIVDCVGVCEQEMTETRPLDQKKSVPFRKLLEHVASGGTDEGYLSSLASRLARLDQQCGGEEHAQIEQLTGGTKLRPNPLAPWELRIGDHRVFYEITAARLVRVLAVGHKVHNELFIRGQKVEI